jgi:HEAT repeat protein
MVVPSTPPIQPGDLAPSPGAPLATSGVRPLRALVPEASAVAVVDVTRTESYDGERLQLHRLHVRRVLRGRLDDPEPGVVELRGGARRTPLLAAGERAVVLLRPAAALSYVAQQLPGLKPFELVSGRDGVVEVGTEAEIAAVAAAIEDGAGIAKLDPEDALAARRRIAFAELASANARLVGDAIVELRQLPDVGALSADERGAIGRVLHDDRVPVAIRIGLIDLVGERQIKDALPLLTGAEAETPQLLDALLAARAKLGAAAGAGELTAYLNAKDPAVRAAAVRALARLDDADALDQVAHYATADGDLSVRTAAVEALGATGRPTVLPVLARTFDVHERELQQASGRALLQVGGTAAAETLLDLALHGATPQTQSYAALLLIASRGRDDATVRRLEASNPGPEVRQLLEHGLEFHHTHAHD